MWLNFHYFLMGEKDLRYWHIYEPQVFHNSILIYVHSFFSLFEPPSSVWLATALIRFHHERKMEFRWNRKCQLKTFFPTFSRSLNNKLADLRKISLATLAKANLSTPKVEAPTNWTTMFCPFFREIYLLSCFCFKFVCFLRLPSKDYAQLRNWISRGPLTYSRSEWIGLTCVNNVDWSGCCAKLHKIIACSGLSENTTRITEKFHRKLESDEWIHLPWNFECKLYPSFYFTFESCQSMAVVIIFNFSCITLQQYSSINDFH